MKIKYTVAASVVIQNENGTSLRSNCSCGYWIDHWLQFSDISSPSCSVKDCNELGLHGAHVTRPAHKDENMRDLSYIVPMCASHNSQKGSSFKSKLGVTFVWANIKKTCSNNYVIS